MTTDVAGLGMRHSLYPGPGTAGVVGHGSVGANLALLRRHVQAPEFSSSTKSPTAAAAMSSATGADGAEVEN